MEQFMANGLEFIEWLQMPAGIGAALAFIIGGYQLMLGGDQGRQKCVKWFIGAVAGLIIVLGAIALANSVSSNVTF